MIGVVADVLEVVVLAAGANAFLGIGGAGGRIGGGLFAEEVGHEGVHAGVGEEQSGGLREQGSGLARWCAASLERNRGRICRISALVMLGGGLNMNWRDRK